MKTIVFVRRAVTPRLYNEVFALKQTGKYKLILVSGVFDQNILRLFNKIFDKILLFNPINLQNLGLTQKVKSSSLIHVMKYLIIRYIDSWTGLLSERKRLPVVIKTLNADLFNIISEPGLIARIMKNTNVPVIIDVLDGSAAKGIEKLSKREYEREKYCFQHANGIIHRGPKIEIDYYKSHGYKITCPMLRYLDYCNKEFFAEPNVKKLSSEDRKYHIAHIGSGIFSHQGVAMIKKIIKQKIHYHLYSIPHSLISPNIFKELIMLNKNEKYFHFEKPVPFDKVAIEISKYDFGAHIREKKSYQGFSPIILKVVTSNRIYTYLEAGLPIMISDHYECMKKIVEENKVCLSVKDEELNNLHNIIDKCNYEELRANVFKVREKLLIDNYAEKLEEFYDSIIQGRL